MSYKLSLVIDGSLLELPVLPEKIEVKSSSKNDKTEVIGLGEVNRLRKKGLREVSFKGHFPAHSAPYVTGKIVDPITAIRRIQAARDSLKPVRLLLVGTDLDINMSVSVDTCDYDERAGEVGDIYYSMKLTEYKDYTPKKIVLPDSPSKPAAVQSPSRSGSPTTGLTSGTRTHTVVSGDTLWGISKRYYGDGAKWQTIYNANKSKIRNPNLIYPGQVFVIP